MKIGERVWYRPPWKQSRPWIPRISFFEAGDEFCNDVMEIQFPFIGMIAIRYRRGPIRTEACDKCQTEWGPWCPNCFCCHYGPRCHDWLSCGHPIPEPVSDSDCPVCGGYYCPVCEPQPEDTCPTTRPSPTVTS